MAAARGRERTTQLLREGARAGQARADGVLVAALVAIALVGHADNLTGQLVSPNLFYVLPVTAVAATGGRRRGLSAVAAVTITGYLASTIDVEAPSTAIIAWNLAARASFLVLVVLLVDALRHTLDDLEALATTDPLTGALNRRALYERASVEISRAARAGRPLALTFFDLDGLKQVNDTDGHDAGDALICSFVTSVRSHLRPTDALARLGGDEFAVLLVDADLDGAEQVARRLQEDLATTGCRASCGIVAVDLTTTDLEASLQRADLAMYRAKQGRLGVVVEV